MLFFRFLYLTVIQMKNVFPVDRSFESLLRVAVSALLIVQDVCSAVLLRVRVFH